MIYYIFRSRDDLAGDLQADMFSSPPEDQWFSKEKLYKVEQSDLNIEHSILTSILARLTLEIIISAPLLKEKFGIKSDLVLSNVL